MRCFGVCSCRLHAVLLLTRHWAISPLQSNGCSDHACDACLQRSSLPQIRHQQTHVSHMNARGTAFDARSCPIPTTTACRSTRRRAFAVQSPCNHPHHRGQCQCCQLLYPGINVNSFIMHGSCENYASLRGPGSVARRASQCCPNVLPRGPGNRQPSPVFSRIK
jgi:hypothetical protein